MPSLGASRNPSCFPFGPAHDSSAMNVARERINLALKILSSRHDPQKHVSATDVHTLKSCVRGDVIGRSVYEMATAVIRAELDREQREIGAKARGGSAVPQEIMSRTP